VWLVVLPLVTPRDIYFPVLHHVMPFVIGLALVLRGRARMAAMQNSGFARALAWSLAALAAVLSAAGLAVALLIPRAPGAPGALSLHGLFLPISALTFGVLGALVASRRPSSPIGWILSAVGVLPGLTLFARMYAPSGLPGAEIAGWLDVWVWMPVNVLPLTFCCCCSPTVACLAALAAVAWAAESGRRQLPAMALLLPAIGPSPRRIRSAFPARPRPWTS
jgi:hypothetical protein